MAKTTAGSRKKKNNAGGANGKNNAGVNIVTGAVAYPIVTPAAVEPLGYARSGGIEATATAVMSGDAWRFKADVTVTNPVIAQYLTNLQAAVVLKIRCPGTSYRKTSRVDATDVKHTATHVNGSFEATLQHDLPMGSVKVGATIEVTPMVVMTKPVKGYTSTDFAPEYLGASYDLEPGAKVAIGTPLRVQTKDRTRQQVFKVRSIDKANAREYDVDLNGDNHIYIDIAAGVYDAYRTGAYDPRFQYVIQRTILLPAMTEAVAKAARVISSGTPDNDRQPWVDVIEGVASKECTGADYPGFTMDEVGPEKRWTPMQVAQTLMPHALKEVMDEIVANNDDE